MTTHGYLSLTAPLVLAVMEGRKTQTMRPILPMPRQREWLTLDALTACPSARPYTDDEGRVWVALEHPKGGPGTCIRAPYAPGDVLWVREGAMVVGYTPRNTRVTVQYDADGATREVPWPSRLRPVALGHRLANGCHREAARTYVRVLSVEPRRVQSITEAEARAEGVEPHDGSVCVGETCRASFRVLWDGLYRRKGLGWDANPWCWMVRFERVEAP